MLCWHTIRLTAVLLSRHAKSRCKSSTELNRDPQGQRSIASVPFVFLIRAGTWRCGGGEWRPCPNAASTRRQPTPGLSVGRRPVCSPAGRGVPDKNKLGLASDTTGRPQGRLELAPLHARRGPWRPLATNRPAKGLDWRSRRASGVSLIRKSASSFALRHSRSRHHSTNTGRTRLPSRAIQRLRLAWARRKTRRSWRSRAASKWSCLALRRSMAACEKAVRLG